jgi:hypothetical protein
MYLSIQICLIKVVFGEAVLIKLMQTEHVEEISNNDEIHKHCLIVLHVTELP